MKIVADSKIPYLHGLLEAEGHEIVYLPGSKISASDVRDAQVLLTRTRTRCDRHLLHGSSIEVIGTATIGMDHIDLEYCKSCGIKVVNAPGCNAPAVAQWVHASILMWMKSFNIHAPITLGVVGVGHVGSIVARWAQQLGYRVLLNDPPRAMQEGEADFFAIEELQRECDIITFHIPLTSDGDYPTWHLCNEQFLNDLRKCRLLINAARGAVCDNQALLNWNGDLALDCWEGEPVISVPLLEKAFIATPHIAGYSLQGKQRGTAMIIEALNHLYGWHFASVQASTPLKGSTHVTPQSILDSYNPLTDTDQLKKAPDSFETLRNTYHLRQEIQ